MGKKYFAFTCLVLALALFFTGIGLARQWEDVRPIDFHTVHTFSAGHAFRKTFQGTASNYTNINVEIVGKNSYEKWEVNVTIKQGTSRRFTKTQYITEGYWNLGSLRSNTKRSFRTIPIDGKVTFVVTIRCLRPGKSGYLARTPARRVTANIAINQTP